MQEEGVPQGSVLSVTLFSVAINNILKKLLPLLNAPFLLMTLLYIVQVMMLLLPVDICKDLSIPLQSGLTIMDLNFHL